MSCEDELLYLVVLDGNLEKNEDRHFDIRRHGADGADGMDLQHTRVEGLPEFQVNCDRISSDNF